MEKFYTSQDKAKTHDTTTPLLKAMYFEFKEISKKKPDSAISKGKIKIVNRLLEKVKTVLEDEESIIFLDLLDEDDVPQASDVTLILSQYVAAMDAFREKHYGWDGSTHDWFIE
ncbi:hypothetical protein KCE62_000978 [Salmonella enterica subsp. enterica serovar Newport]|uniref:Uncharacterized protein n=2 Tax=Salmonella enterica TaxID=28901 RepID=A0A3V2JJT5_SALNE|nr:hypothetical protein [Salmonella enterica]EAA7200966.1 hypothetical protein [Salmonella enterica subsp. enterica serovar Newport]EAA7382651.1 hypothetical protein [Salmonella enterica subsp. enterica]EBF8286315.1 hypothetical protein [Salmonella enterica subsp. houtenae]ECU3286076.1 hypothetical protein [Salmonella enterica subsp. houtenae serovar Houten]EDS4968385.1 hypothetical protein [Salmonella enterica subsp. enterica serovar O rough]EDV0742682.1 hypothetical protein [Salmonella ente